MKNGPAEIKNTRGVKHLMESSNIIDQIFHERKVKVDAEKQAKADLLKREESELKEVIEANKTLKDRLQER